MYKNVNTVSDGLSTHASDATGPQHVIIIDDVVHY